MKGKEDLFELIRAMTPSEKRYFTLDAKKSGGKGSRYRELFRLINDMEEYDEEALRQRFPRSLPFDKAYLYDALLRSMRDYHSAHSRSAQIKERLLDARYLFERGLYEQCEVRLEEARRLAGDLGDNLLLLELNREFRRLALATKGRQLEDQLAAFAGEQENLLAALREEFLYTELYERLLSRVIRKFELRSEAERAEFLAGLPDGLLHPKALPQTALARLKYYQSQALFHQLLGDFERVMEYFSLVVDWWEDHPKYKEEEFYRYIIDFANLLHAYITNGQVALLPQLLRRLEETEPDTETARRILFQKVAIYRLIAFINSDVQGEVKKLTADIEEGLEKYPVQSNTRSTLISNTAILLFTRGKYDDCLIWCARILGDRKNQYRQDIRTLIYLLNLAAAYQLDDDSLLEGAYRSTYRYLKKQEQIAPNGFEMTFLDFVRRLITEEPAARPGIWRALRHYLSDLRTDPLVKIKHGMDELFLLWVDGHLADSRQPSVRSPQSAAD